MSSTKVDFFLRANRGLEHLVGAAHGLHGALWLGFLDRGELNAVTERFYSASPSHNERAFNLSGLFAWERTALEASFAGCQTLLVAAAGGGREVIALCRQGVRADGFECNPDLARLGEDLLSGEGLPGRMLPSPADEVPSSLGEYDGGVVGFGAYMHLAGRATRVGFLREFRRHLRPGAPLLLSFPTRGESRADRWSAAIAQFIRRLRGNPEPVEVGDRLIGTFGHSFTEAEISEELREAGFSLERFNAQPFGHAIGRFRTT